MRLVKERKSILARNRLLSLQESLLRLFPLVDLGIRLPCFAFLLAALFLGRAAQADKHYPILRKHPRIFLTNEAIPNIAKNSSRGGSHRKVYLKIKASSDAQIDSGRIDPYFLPNHALIYLIHKYWNETGYSGQAFPESKYWQAVRRGLLLNNWLPNDIGACLAISADWIWDRLSKNEQIEIAREYGVPRTSPPNEGAWTRKMAAELLTRVMRSGLFHKAGIYDQDYAAEYDTTLSFIEHTYGPALQLSGPGVAGPYENTFQYMRAWAFEAMYSLSGKNPWQLAPSWSDNFGKWNIYLKNPYTAELLDRENAPIQEHTADPLLNMALFAYRGGDPFAQELFKKRLKDVLSLREDDPRLRNLWSVLLWYQPNAKTPDYDQIPTAARFGQGGADVLAMRSLWNSSAPIVASFEAQKHFSAAQHADAGSFSIWKRGPLAVDAGYFLKNYASNGQSYHRNFYIRSIAHNTVLAYDPEERFVLSKAPSSMLHNDGGQPVLAENPTYKKFLESGEFASGEISRYHHSRSITYARSNLSGAFNSSLVLRRFGHKNYQNKFNYYEREFVYLQPDIFVVLDRLKLKNKNVARVFNLNVAGKPVVVGEAKLLKGTKSSGITEYRDADEFYISNSQEKFGAAKLFVRSLLPSKKHLVSFGGTVHDSDEEKIDFSTWIGGFNDRGRYQPELGQNFDWGHLLVGWQHLEKEINDSFRAWGRIEIVSDTPGTEDLFLTVLHPSDPDVKILPRTDLIQSEESVGVLIGGSQILIFNRLPAKTLEAISYKIPKASLSKQQHFLFGLNPSQKYEIFRQDKSFEIRAVKASTAKPLPATSHLKTVKSSSGGVLIFSVD
ncbi:MAG: heparinase II/III family protein [Bdellovibrionales bacterium]|nr:heparinase II/III family protein [Bdellovibrionales bacterium]